ncbi:MAG: hypothetical protein HY824_05725 [Acidobacteria bacterium]|nr:hypothetical protein [Acidobacteriota bacterium]
MEYRYKTEVLDELARHGVRPKPTTAPEVLRDFVNDLYRFELRRLRDRLVRREIPKPEYSAHVVEARNRYRLLALKLWEWTE